MIRSTPALMPCGELTLLEVRRDRFADDPARRHVGQHALEAVADFDAHALVVLGDEEDRAVVLALLTDLPGLGDAQRVLLDRLRLGGRHDQDDELVGRARLPVGELRLERLSLRRRQRAGLVGDPAGQRRDTARRPSQEASAAPATAANASDQRRGRRADRSPEGH